MVESREVSLNQKELAENTLSFPTKASTGEKKNSASLENTHTTFEAIPVLMSHKMNKRFSRRLRYLLENSRQI